mgnify:CR=1 FL=1
MCVRAMRQLYFSADMFRIHPLSHSAAQNDVIRRKLFEVLLSLQNVFKNEVKSKSRGVYDVNKEYMKVIIQFGLVSLELR